LTLLLGTFTQEFISLMDHINPLAHLLLPAILSATQKLAAPTLKKRSHSQAGLRSPKGKSTPLLSIITQTEILLWVGILRLANMSFLMWTKYHRVRLGMLI